MSAPALWMPAAAAVPLLFAAAAVVAFGRRGRAAAPAWRVVETAAAGALLAAVAMLAAVATHGAGHAWGLRADLPGALVATLVAFIGWVIARTMRTALAGEPDAGRAAGWLGATLAAVSVVVVSDHLAVLTAAWMGASLALHRLLLFYGDRPSARVAAHKKVLFSRLADLAMAAGVALLGTAFGTLSIGALLAQAGAAPGLPPMAQAGTMLLVVAALLKCAQLPFHGWLIQVMEAPTPVSALLHAGVVNLGGFVLIRLHPLLAETPAALVLLGLAGAATAVLAALVMTTRISIKVALAWSTAAQMGFMLVQIALGLPEMALLHLLAHSLYKAHAFLAAGGVVRRQQLRQLAPAPVPTTAARWVAAAIGGLPLTAAAGWLWGASATDQPALWLTAAIVALALVPLWLGAPVAGGGVRAAVRWTALAALPLAYFGLHAAMAAVTGTPATATPPVALIGGVALAFAGLYVLQAALSVAPQGRLARRLYPWFYGGLFLDEAVSRAAFRVFPPHPAPARRPKASSTMPGAHP